MKQLIITSGGTVELWDDVRGHTNLARGNLGVYIAQVALKKGWHVTLLHGYFAKTLPSQPNLTQIQFYGVEQLEMILQEQVQKHKSPTVIMTAAISDWTVEKMMTRDGQLLAQNEKISSDVEPVIYFKRAPKLLAQIKKWNNNSCVIGFKLESVEQQEELLARAINRLHSSACDAIVANSSRSLSSEENDHILVEKNENVNFIAKSKADCAEKLVHWIEQRDNNKA